jgi:hypothetical protein
MIKPLLKYLVVLSLVLNGCSENAQPSVEFIKKSSLVTEDDIYSFMNYLMYEDILKRDYRIELTPEEDFGFMKSVDSILYLLEIGEDKSIKDHSKLDSFSKQYQGDTLLTAPGTITFNWGSHSIYSEVLTSEDSKFIKQQIIKNKNFKWDNDRLGFLEKSSHWYQVSVPCFSRDKKHVIILIRSLCPGLCGGSELFLFTKKGIEWEHETLEGGYH